MKKSLLSEIQSQAITATIFFATVLIVMRHGFNLHRFYPGGSPWMPVCDLNTWLQINISRLTDLAIPTFFTISGFLFFLGMREYSEIPGKLKRRLRSLLVPYLLWNFLLLAGVMCIARCPYFHEQAIQSFGVSYSWQWCLKQLTTEPIVGYFWYIRTLILFNCLAPVFLLLYRHRIFSLAALAVLMVYWMPWDGSLLSSEGMLFFYFGGWIGFHEWHKDLQYYPASWLLLPVILFLSIAPGYIHLGKVWNLQMFLSVFFLIQLGLFCAGRPRVMKAVGALGQYSFLIYALHGYMLGGLNLFWGRCLAHTAWNSLWTYGFNVVFTILLATGLGWILRTFVPKIYGVLTGGRGV